MEINSNDLDFGDAFTYMIHVNCSNSIIDKYLLFFMEGGVKLSQLLL